MQFTNKATTTVTGQQKSRKPLIAAAVGAGVLVPALAVGSPAMAATWGPAQHDAGMVQLDSSARHLPGPRAPGLRGNDGPFGRDQRDGLAGHPGQTQPPADNGQGTGSQTTTGGTTTTGGGTTTTGGGTTTTGGGTTTGGTTTGGTTTGGTTTTTTSCPPYTSGPFCIGHRSNQFF